MFHFYLTIGWQHRYAYFKSVQLSVQANQLTFSRDMKCIYAQIITEIVCWALSTGRTLITKTHDCAWTHSVQMQWEHWSRAATVLSTYVYITVSALEKGLVAFLILIQGEKNKNNLWLVCMPSNQSQSSWVKMNPGCNDGAPAKRCGVVCTWRGEATYR